jgi:RNA polymerase sigma-70 factor (ECF subfamily)
MSQLLAGMQRDAEPSDEDLVLELARGRPEALGALYSRYAGLIFSIAAQSLGSVAAEEVVQETFLAIWRGARTFDPAQGAFRPWALRIAHWRVLNELRRRRRHPSQPDEDAPLLRIADAEPGPEEHLWRGERARLIQDALETLSPKQRQAVALAFMEDLTHEQVAQVLGVPLGTAKTRIRDGMLRLRALLMPIAASLVLVAALGAGILRWLEQEHQVRQSERAVVLLTSSTVTAIRVESINGTDTHAMYRFEPGTNLAVLSISHAEPGPYQARAQFGERWVPIGTVVAGDDGRGVAIAEGPDFATAPDAIEVSAGGAVLLSWHAP